MADKNKISGFKKFTDLKAKEDLSEVELSAQPKTDSDIPGNPNLPNTSKKIERMPSRKGIIPQDQNVDLNKPIGETETNESDKVNFYGKVAKFPKKTKASKAYNFLENVKISKNSIWYILIEKQDNELQMVKYNHKEGVDLNKFVNELKSYYITKNRGNKAICEAVAKIGVDGNDKYSKITNISKIKIDNKLLITKITEDLIKLLSK